VEGVELFFGSLLPKATVMATKFASDLDVTLSGPVTLGKPSSGTGLLQLAHASSSFLTTIKAGNAAAAASYTWPTNVGAAGSTLTDAAGTGVLSWVVPTGGGGGISNFGTPALGQAGVWHDATHLSGTDTPTWAGLHTFNAGLMTALDVKIGIGNPSPQQALEISASGAGTTTGAANIRMSYSGGPTTYYSEITNFFSGTLGSGNMIFNVHGVGGIVNPLTLSDDNKVYINGTPIFKTHFTLSSATVPAAPNAYIRMDEWTTFSAVPMLSFSASGGTGHFILSTWDGSFDERNNIQLSVYGVISAVNKIALTAQGDGSVVIPKLGVGTTIGTSPAQALQIASGGHLQLGNAAATGLTAGALAGTTNASIVIKDSTGQSYRIPCII
jgi:hypothetical protein